MAETSLPTREALFKLFKYVPDNGSLLWRSRPDTDFKQGKHPASRICNMWNALYAVKMAGSPTISGYICVGLDGKSHLAHVLVWNLHNGPVPQGLQVDHINNIRDDNRIENLRLATPAENRRNAKLRCDNLSQAKGVDFGKRQGQWRARITCDGKTTHLGWFDTRDDAIAARRVAAKRLHGDFAREA